MHFCHLLLQRLVRKKSRMIVGLILKFNSWRIQLGPDTYLIQIQKYRHKLSKNCQSQKRKIAEKDARNLQMSTKLFIMFSFNKIISLVYHSCTKEPLRLSLNLSFFIDISPTYQSNQFDQLKRRLLHFVHFDSVNDFSYNTADWNWKDLSSQVE